MQINNSSIGCGTGEIYGLYGSTVEPDRVFYSLLTLIACKVDYAIIVFGDGVKEKNGQAFAEFLTHNNLGEVVPSKVVRSRLHTEAQHQGYQMWLWYVDHTALLKWYKDKKEEFKLRPFPKSPF